MAFHFRHVGTSICPQEFNSLKIHLLWKLKRVEVYAVNFQYNKIWRRTRASDVLIDYKQNTSSATQSFKPLAKQSSGNCQNWRLDIEKTEQKILGVVARGVFRMLRHVVWQEPGSDDLIQPGVPAGVPSRLLLLVRERKTVTIFFQLVPIQPRPQGFFLRKREGKPWGRILCQCRFADGHQYAWRPPEPNWRNICL